MDPIIYYYIVAFIIVALIVLFSYKKHKKKKTKPAAPIIEPQKFNMLAEVARLEKEQELYFAKK